MGLSESDLNIRDDGASARRMRAEREAVRAISTAALEGGVVADALIVCRDLAEMDDDTRLFRAIDRLDALQAAAKAVTERAKAR